MSENQQFYKSSDFLDRILATYRQRNHTLHLHTTHRDHFRNAINMYLFKVRWFVVLHYKGKVSGEYKGAHFKTGQHCVTVSFGDWI